MVKLLDQPVRCCSKAVCQIKKAGNKAVVVTGIQDENAQLLALAINNALQSEAIDVVSTKNVRSGNTAKVNQLTEDMASGKVGAVLIANSNPVYSLAKGSDFAEALKKVALSVTFSMSADQTAEASQYVARRLIILSHGEMLKSKKDIIAWYSQLFNHCSKRVS